ncbi:MAG: trypsin-like peptidase domain-containing protein [Deltaproteobacteria bacterium]|nr:trypsin-like peptidase domain-containing protein [Deltaproteobacteria bacterium]
MKVSKAVVVAMLFAAAASAGFFFGKTPPPESGSGMAYAASVDAAAGNIFVQISRKMIPSVVNVFTTSKVRAPWRSGEGSQDDLWRKFFEEFFGGGQDQYGGIPVPPPGQEGPVQRAMSLGSGFVIESTPTGGLILTNNHVVEGADEIKIKFTEALEEKESDAEVIGSDPDLDIALIQVKTKRKLQAVALGDSDKLEVGEWIAAVGNPFGHGHSISHGIVSAKERALPGGFGKYLQVDAPINPGNSGGPLVNVAGEVVGINNAIDARGPGIGFAIPINQVKAVLPQLKTKGKVERGYIGVNVDELRPDLAKSLKLDEGLRAPIVTHVVPGQPADKAKLQAYDVITEVAGKPVRTPGDLVSSITNIPVGEKAKIKVFRSGKEMELSVTVARRPDFRGERPRKADKKRPKGARVGTGMTIETIDDDVARELGLPENFEGIVVSQVAPDGPANRAGLGRGDVILEVDRKPVKTEADFYKIVTQKKTYLLRVRKQDETGREVFVVVALKLAASDRED